MLMLIVTLTMMMVDNNWSALFLPWVFDLVWVFFHGREATIDTYLIIYANVDNSDDECIVLERKEESSNAYECINEAFFNEY